MLIYIPIFFTLLCLVSVVVADNSSDIAGPKSCPKPKKLNEDERLFMIRVSLIRSMGQLRTVCSESKSRYVKTKDYLPMDLKDRDYNNILTFRENACVIANNAGAENAGAQEKETFEHKLIALIIAMNQLPGKVCGQIYAPYRLTLQSKVMKPNGEIANHMLHHKCYSAIFASKEYKKLAGDQSNADLIKALDLKALQLDQVGKGALSCAVTRLKDDFKKVVASTGFKLTSGTALVAAGIIGMVLSIISVGTLGVGVAVFVGIASFVVGAFLAVYIVLQDPKTSKEWMAKQCEYMDSVARRSS